MDIRLLIGIIATVLNIAGYIPYIRDILRGKVKPQRITWGIWTVLTSIAAYNQVVNGGGWSSLFFISTTFLVAITFIMSLRYGVGGASRLDMISLFLSGGLLLYWVISRETRYSTLIAVVIDGIGAVPTIVKTRLAPDTESYPQWVFAAIGGLFTIFAVESGDWVLVIYPVYIFVFNALIVATKFFSERNLHRLTS